VNKGDQVFPRETGIRAKNGEGLWGKQPAVSLKNKRRLEVGENVRTSGEKSTLLCEKGKERV